MKLLRLVLAWIFNRPKGQNKETNAMNLNTLSADALSASGSGIGFYIKSVAHPDRKFLVETKLANGKFVITRLDTGANYFVLGTEDRYELAVSFARISEVRAEIGELTARIAELEGTLCEYGIGAVG